MSVLNFLPSATLAPYIACYLLVDCRHASINSMLPGPAQVLGFRLRGTTNYWGKERKTLPFAVLSGMRKSVQLMEDAPETTNLIVVFKMAGAAAFFREPLHEVFGTVESLEEFSGYRQELNMLEDRLCALEDNASRILLLENFLCRRLREGTNDLLVQEAIHIIRASKGQIKIASLCQQLYISTDAFEKRFRKITGASPKQFCYITRMNHAVAILRKENLAQLALDLGFYDQAHFNRDFKLFTGSTPLHYLNRHTIDVQ
jgi:AraC-like DNA-binding protein